MRAAGHPRTRGSYFVNIQTEGPTNDDLWQHRLYFTRDDGGWEDVFVSSFISPFPDHLFDRVSGSRSHLMHL